MTEGLVYLDYTVTSVNNIDKENNFIIYPNPASTYVQIESDNLQNKCIEILDITGKVLISSSLRGTKQSVDISDLQNGIYFIMIENQVQKLIKK